MNQTISTSDSTRTRARVLKLLAIFALIALTATACNPFWGADVTKGAADDPPEELAFAAPVEPTATPTPEPTPASATQENAGTGGNDLFIPGLEDALSATPEPTATAVPAAPAPNEPTARPAPSKSTPPPTTNPQPKPEPEPNNPAAPVPVTPLGAGSGVNFGAGPFVNDNGTYYSTLGAPAELMPWQSSNTLLWNRRLPNNTPALPNSPTIARQIDEIVHGERIVSYGSAIESGANAPNVLLVDSAREDFVEVTTNCHGSSQTGWGWSGAEFASYVNSAYPGRSGIPMPSDFQMSPDDSDSHLMIYDYREDVLLEFWVFQTSNITGGAPAACWGGIIRNYSTQSDGIFPYPTGVSASGLTIAGTMITFEDLRRGRIDHALSVSTLQILHENHLTNSVTTSYPANRNDGQCSAQPTQGQGSWWNTVMDGVDNDTANCLREGQYLRLPANYDTSGIADPVARMMAEAMRDYGIVVNDYAGCFCIQGEAGRTPTVNGLGADPWDTVYANITPWDMMYQLPWADLEVLPVDWSMPSGYTTSCVTTYTWYSSDAQCQRGVAPYQPN